MHHTREAAITDAGRLDAGPPGSLSTPRTGRPRILIADDEDAVLNPLREYLGCCGYEVMTASRPREATELLSATDFAVVITDLRFWGVGGTQGLAIARAARARNPSGRVFLLTAHRTPEADAEIERIGVDELLEKPIPLWELARRIMNAAPVLPGA